MLSHVAISLLKDISSEEDVAHVLEHKLHVPNLTTDNFGAENWHIGRPYWLGKFKAISKVSKLLVSLKIIFHLLFFP